MDSSTDTNDNHFEIKCGLVIAVFAAVMSISDVFAGKYGEDEFKTINEKSAAYMWYQAKSIRASIAEGQRDLLLTMQNANGLNRGPASEAMETHLKKLGEKINKYEKQKKEILVGSSALSKEEWVQEVDDQYGKVVGAKEYENQLIIYEKVSNRFDYAALFFQICVVMGAISLVIRRQVLRTRFFYAMITLGLVGTGFSLFAFMAAQTLA